jgi:2-polyprenyl-6-methoxyphenol hydroxylase-like FAD-dependent oxidoreductase
MRALIIGGGIGGLAAAVALRQVGCEVAVFEQAQALREAGTGLTLWPNATRVLCALGLGDGVRAVATPLRRGQIRDRSGRILADIPLDEVGRRAGGEVLGIHRADLLALLAREVDRADLRLGARLTDFRADTDGVTALFADGRSDRGDLLVGADGIHSRVRDMVLADPRRYCGYVGWRGAVPFDSPHLARDLSIWTFGRGAQFGLIPIGGGRVFWFGTGSMPEGSIPRLGLHRDELMARFGDWHPPIPDLVASLAEENVLRTPIYDRPPVRRWASGRVTLLGDAAHATTPTLGQGACLAIESAYVLADCLGTAATVEAGLRRYEAERRRRTARVIRRSWRAGGIIQSRNPALCRARDRILGLVPTSWHLRNLQSIIAPGCVAPATSGVLA